MEFKQYPSYKPSGVEWLGDVPEHWNLKKFCYLFDENKKKNIGLQETNVLSLSYGNIKEKNIDDNKGLLPESFETYQIIEPNDIIFRFTDLQNDKRSLRSAISKYHGIITSAYIGVKTKQNADFYNYLFRAYDLQKVFYSMGEGMRQSLKMDELNKMPVVLPSKDEQKYIVSFLDAETARIDNLITKQKKLIGLFKENIITLAMLEQMQGEGELVRLSSVVSEVYRPVHLNNAIEYTALGIYNRGRGLFHKPLTLGCDMGDSSFFYINCGDLILSGQFAWEGAVAMATNAEDGCVVSHRYPVLRGNLVSTEYLLALFMSDYGTYLLNDCSRGSAGRNRPLNINMLLKQKIRIPSDKTQQEIKKLLLEKSILEINVNKTIEKLKEYRASIISHAVTGKIDVRDFC
ncbi:Type I restriction-modification system, specificity subunit S [Acinetobacter sp. 8I-beige]|uniref:restriction endonuclease subunit S n=1 Tax=Acinetobacter sp. 8I-beige TaxID=2653125 RepID=UPI0012EFB025|nr:restriction endonuclease subunit S [Acinetobacter sp. 8I-beige]VXA86973.1 Type I restriction-modification system, specificity subunit S [Acinetobacter sp. 8I-beige]